MNMSGKTIKLIAYKTLIEILWLQAEILAFKVLHFTFKIPILG